MAAESEVTIGTEASNGLPARPYLMPWYRIGHENGQLILEYAHGVVVLEGTAVEKLMPALLPLLDGTRTLPQITAHLGERATPAIVKALEMLQERKVLTDGPPAPADTLRPAAEAAEFLAAVSRGERTVAESEEILALAAVSVVGSGPAAAQISALLGSCGVDRLQALDWPSSVSDLKSQELALVAPEPEQLPRVDEWNRLAIEAGSPWLQVLPFDGRIAVVGPIFLPGESCCYECYQRRRGAALGYGDETFWAVEGTPASYPVAPPLQQAAGGFAVALALQWLCERASGAEISPIAAVMHALEWGPPLKVSAHRIFRVPRCRVCFGGAGPPSPWHE